MGTNINMSCSKIEYFITFFTNKLDSIVDDKNPSNTLIKMKIYYYKKTLVDKT